MTANRPLLALALAFVGAAAVGQEAGQLLDAARVPGVPGSADPNRTAFLAANCSNRPATAPARPTGSALQTPPVSTPAVFQDVSSTGIPGVIAAGQHWKVLWEDKGNNADGIVAFDDGSVWVAQPDKSDIVRIDSDGKASVIYTDTYSGGTIAANSKGQVFLGERSLGNAIWSLLPRRQLFANNFNNEPLDCVAGFINDMSADSKGGIYLTMSGVYYVSPNGVVMGRFGTVGGNGIILSPDEKTLYVTGRLAAAGVGAGNGGLVAFDVRPDGSLANERQFAETCGDGSAVDAAGRIYCTGGRMPDPADPRRTITGIGVVSPDGRILGVIPQPRGVNSLAFGGPDKQTLFAVGNRDVQLMSIRMIAQGYKKRPK